MLEVHIKGNRGDGKTELLILISKYLETLGYTCRINDEGTPRDHHQYVLDEIKDMHLRIDYDRDYHNDGRDVNIIVDKTTEEEPRFYKVKL